jgi:hypothetical protein
MRPRSNAALSLAPAGEPRLELVLQTGRLPDLPGHIGVVTSVALSGDGNTLAVAAYVEDNGGQGIRGPELQPFLIVDYLDPWRERQSQAEESGAVYLYTRSGTTWTQRAYIKGSNTGAGDEFGSAVAVSGDGRIIVVGAHNEDSAARGLNGNQADNSGDDSGAAYVFTY